MIVGSLDKMSRRRDLGVYPQIGLGLGRGG